MKPLNTLLEHDIKNQKGNKNARLRNLLTMWILAIAVGLFLGSFDDYGNDRYASVDAAAYAFDMPWERQHASPSRLVPGGGDCNGKYAAVHPH